MKNYISKSLRLISLGYLAMPVLYPIWLSVWFDIPISRLISFSLSLFYWVILGLCVISGYGLWVLTRWSWYVFLATNLLLVYETAFVAATFGEGRTSVLAFILTVLLAFVFLVRVGNEVRVPYFLPNIRWWESDPGKKLGVPTTLILGAKDVEGEIVDLATSGCFVKSSGEFHQDEKLALNFSLFGHEIEAVGYVVWCAESAVTHPRGVGIKFDSMSRAHRRSLRAGVSRIRKLNVFNSVSQPLAFPEADGEESEVSHAKG